MWANRIESLIYTAGQGPAIPRWKIMGKLEAELMVSEGRESTRAYVIECLASPVSCIDSLDQMTRVARSLRFVGSRREF